MAEPPRNRGQTPPPLSATDEEAVGSGEPFEGQYAFKPINISPRSRKTGRVRRRLAKAAHLTADWLAAGDPPPHSGAPPDDSSGDFAAPEDIRAMQIVYEDVRGFSQHMDEKLRSLITALAFLTAAGVAIFVFVASAGANDLRFDGRSWNVANVFFIIFLGSVTISLSAALIAMDPTGHAPRFLRGVRAPTSVLYYESILVDDWWRQRATPLDTDRLNARLLRSLKADTLELARRSKHKAGYTQTAEALVGLALGALLVVGIARLPDSGTTVRSWLVMGALFAFALFPAGTYLRMRYIEDFPALAGEAVSPSRTNLLRLTAYFMLPTLSLTILGLLPLIGRAHWPYVAYGAIWIGASRLLLRARIAPWIALFGSAAALSCAGYMIHDANAFKAPLPFRLQLSYRLRSVGALTQPVLCTRVSGQADSTVEIRLTGSSIPATPLIAHLSSRGVRTSSFAILPDVNYQVQVREVTDPEFIAASFRYQHPPNRFDCPPLAPGQSIFTISTRPITPKNQP